jgi:hypothetical protein
MSGKEWIALHYAKSLGKAIARFLGSASKKTD